MLWVMKGLRSMPSLMSFRQASKSGVLYSMVPHPITARLTLSDGLGRLGETPPAKNGHWQPPKSAVAPAPMKNLLETLDIDILLFPVVLFS